MTENEKEVTKEKEESIVDCVPCTGTIPKGSIALEVFESDNDFKGVKFSEKERGDIEDGLEFLQAQINKDAADRKAGKPAHIFEEALHAVGF